MRRPPASAARGFSIEKLRARLAPHAVLEFRSFLARSQAHVALTGEAVTELTVCVCTVCRLDLCMSSPEGPGTSPVSARRRVASPSPSTCGQKSHEEESVCDKPFSSAGSSWRRCPCSPWAKSPSPCRYDGRTCEHGADHAFHVDVHAKAGRDAKNGTDMQVSTHRVTQGSRQRRAGVCLKPELEKRRFFVPSDTGHYCTTCRVTETQKTATEASIDGDAAIFLVHVFCWLPFSDGTWARSGSLHAFSCGEPPLLPV